MSISISEIKQLLIDKKVTNLYHANSVTTAISFLQNEGLLSRGAVEDLGFSQTSQVTDQKDKELGIYYDIFFDSDDIHKRAKRINNYGPVTFVYSIDVLDIIDETKLRITKDNPIRWEETTRFEERYFTDINEMRTLFVKGNFSQHITICDMRKLLTISPFLIKIIIDNPDIKDTKLFNEAYYAISEILSKKRINSLLEVRKCSNDCKCKKMYQACKSEHLFYKFKVK